MTTPAAHLQPRIDRRTAIKWMLTASSALMLPGGAFGQPANSPANPPAPAPTIPPLPPRPGYGVDPNLVNEYRLGDYWPLTLTDAQRRTATVLCDVILPADEVSPSAATVGVPDFIDEWISAPYPSHARDRVVILEGLLWLDAEAQRRFGRGFAELNERQHRAMCEDICLPPGAGPEFEKAAHFFSRFRDLTMIGFYTTPEGMKDIGYVGNLPSATFDGPPAEVLARLGIDGQVPG